METGRQRSAAVALVVTLRTSGISDSRTLSQRGVLPAGPPEARILLFPVCPNSKPDFWSTQPPIPSIPRLKRPELEASNPAQVHSATLRGRGARHVATLLT
jgi:hypothetical protein